jgi:hypothetical protein
MNNTNNHPHTDQEVLAMLCGVVPPEYREGTKHQLVGWVRQADSVHADLLARFPPPDEAEPMKTVRSAPSRPAIEGPEINLPRL